MNKDELWKTLTEPVKKYCMNCSHWVQVKSTHGLTHNVCDIEKFNVCAESYMRGDMTYESKGYEHHWEYKR